MKVEYSEENNEVIAYVSDDLRFHADINDLNELEDFWFGNDLFDVNIWFDEHVEMYRFGLYDVKNGETKVLVVLDEGLVDFI